MRRKIARIGPATLMVSLPSKWVKREGLSKGDELEITAEPGRLLISTTSTPKQLSTEIDISQLDIMIARFIHALYKRGYDEIKVVFDNPELIESIHKAIGKEAVGYEVVEQGKTTCLIRNVAGELNDYDAILRRTFLVLLEMAEEGEKAIKTGDFQTLQNIVYLEETNNRFTTQLRRYLNKKQPSTIQYYLIEELEKIADQYKYLYSYIISKNSVHSTEQLAKINNMLRQYYEIFYSFEIPKLVGLSRQRKQLITECIQLLETTEDTLMAHHCLVLTQRIFSLVDPLISLRIVK